MKKVVRHFEFFDGSLFEYWSVNNVTTRNFGFIIIPWKFWKNFEFYWGDFGADNKRLIIAIGLFVFYCDFPDEETKDFARSYFDKN